MNKTKQMRLTLAKLLTLYRELPTDEGVTLVSENDFALGSEIFVLTESGDIETAPDGIYHTETATYTVADGIIASIEEHNTVEVVEVENPSLVDSELEIIRKRLEETEKTLKERDLAIEELNTQNGKLKEETQKLNESLNTANKEIENLTKTNADLTATIKDKDAQIAGLEAQIAELLGKSGKPVVEETIEESEKEDFAKSSLIDRQSLISKYRK